MIYDNLYLKYEIQKNSKQVHIYLQDQYGYVIEQVTIELYCLPQKNE